MQHERGMMEPTDQEAAVTELLDYGLAHIDGLVGAAITSHAERDYVTVGVALSHTMYKLTGLMATLRAVHGTPSAAEFADITKKVEQRLIDQGIRFPGVDVALELARRINQ